MLPTGTSERRGYCDNCYGDLDSGWKMIGMTRLCGACADWWEYWMRLTPAQQAAELDAMGEYANEYGGER